MALTDKIIKIADKTRELTGTTEKMTLDEIPVKMDLIKTNPVLQNKSIEIIENGTTNIVADEGYDGLYNVKVTTNVEKDNNCIVKLFVQEEEPIDKNGIWLQTNQKEVNNYYYLKYESNIYTTWKNNSPSYPMGIYGHGSAVVDGYIYTFGGLDLNYSRTNKVYKYDVANNSFSSVKNLPYYSHVPFVVAVGTDIYIIGGQGGSSASATTKLNYNYKYDTLTDTYTKMANIPYSAHNIRGVAVGTDIYLFGGSISGACNNAYKYDTLTDSYTQLELLPYNIGGSEIVTDNEFIYIFGGGANAEGKRGFLKYSISANNYLFVETELGKIGNGGGILEGNYIYIFGGYNSDGGSSNKFYEYSIKDNTYKQLDSIISTVANFGFASIDNTLYILGGQGASGASNPIQKRTITPYNENTIIFKRQVEKYENSMLNIKENIWLYQLNVDFADNIPTYYCDGAQWIRIKN